MRTNQQIINLVVDGEITTSEQGSAVIEEEAQAMATYMNLTTDVARRTLFKVLDGIVTRLCTPTQGDRIRRIYSIPKEND